MRLAKGPRPWPVRLFALAFTAQALATFWHTITDLPQAQAALGASFPAVGFDRDLTIVATSAQLTIALIPVALIWFAASRLARWLVVAFALAKLMTAPDDLLSLLLTLGGAALLLTPAAARWFARPGSPVTKIAR